MHEISSEFLNHDSSRRRSAAEKLSQNGRYYKPTDYNNDSDSGYCDCVACSYSEFKQITGLGQPVTTTSTTSSSRIPASSSGGILGVAPPYFQCKVPPQPSCTIVCNIVVTTNKVFHMEYLTRFVEVDLLRKRDSCINDVIIILNCFKDCHMNFVDGGENNEEVMQAVVMHL